MYDLYFSTSTVEALRTVWTPDSGLQLTLGGQNDQFFQNMHSLSGIRRKYPYIEEYLPFLYGQASFQVDNCYVEL